MEKEEAERIVNAIFSELEGRGGFDILNLIRDDTETYDEMHATCVLRVLKVVEVGPGKFDHHWQPESS